VNLVGNGVAFCARVPAAPAPSAGPGLGRAVLRERTVTPTAPQPTGEVRLRAGAVSMAAMTPTADIQDPMRVRSWSPPV
jgi:hypothetical protein